MSSAAYVNDKASTSSDVASKPVNGYNLDDKRRAALAEVDSAKFS